MIRSLLVSAVLVFLICGESHAQVSLVLGETPFATNPDSSGNSILVRTPGGPPTESMALTEFCSNLGVNLDALSLGLDDRFDPNSGFVYSISLSGSGKTNGRPGLAIAAESVREVEADLFFVQDAVASNAKRLPWKIADENNAPAPTSRFVINKGSLDLSGAFGSPRDPAGVSNIAGLSLHAYDGSQTIYFSIDAPAGGFSPADILRLSPGARAQVEVFITAEELGLDPDTDNLNALALTLDSIPAGFDLGWFSLARGSSYLSGAVAPGEPDRTAADVFQFSLITPLLVSRIRTADNLGFFASNPDADVDAISHLDPEIWFQTIESDGVPGLEATFTIESSTQQTGYTAFTRPRSLSSGQGPSSTTPKQSYPGAISSFARSVPPVGDVVVEVFGFSSGTTTTVGEIQAGTISIGPSGFDAFSDVSAVGDATSGTIQVSWSNLPGLALDSIVLAASDGTEATLPGTGTSYAWNTPFRGVLEISLQGVTGADFSNPVLSVAEVTSPTTTQPPQSFAAERIGAGSLRVTWTDPVAGSYSDVHLRVDGAPVAIIPWGVQSYDIASPGIGAFKIDARSFSPSTGFSPWTRAIGTVAPPPSGDWSQTTQGPEPYGVTVDEEGHRVFVNDYVERTTYIYDRYLNLLGSFSHPIPPGPPYLLGIAWEPTSKTLYHLVSWTNSCVLRRTTLAGALISEVPVFAPGRTLGALSLSCDGSRLVAVDIGNREYVEIESDGTLGATFPNPLGSSAFGEGISRAGMGAGYDLAVGPPSGPDVDRILRVDCAGAPAGLTAALGPGTGFPAEDLQDIANTGLSLRGVSFNTRYLVGASDSEPDRIYVRDVSPPSHLVWAAELPSNVDSVGSLRAALGGSGESFIVSTALDSDSIDHLAPGSKVWCLLGTFPDNHSLSVEEGLLLANAIERGISIYVEGGDVWGFDAPTQFQFYDGVMSAEDGDDSFTGMTGQGIALGLDASYTQDQGPLNDYTDRLIPASGSDLFGGSDEVTFVDDVLGYNVSIAASPTLGFGFVWSQSWEFGGYDGNQTALFALVNGHLNSSQPASRFVRGDVNSDLSIDLTDGIALLDTVFNGGSPTCPNSADVNDDGSLNLADVILLLGFLFEGFAPPASPYPACGTDPTPGDLPCASSACP